MPALSIAKVMFKFNIEASWMTWSYALCIKVEYIATNGLKPSFAMADIEVTACCSAIATSQKRSGNSCMSASMPVPVGIAAVTPTMSLCSLAIFKSCSLKIAVADLFDCLFINSPLFRSNGPTPCQFS